MLKVTILLVDFITTLLVFDYPKFNEFLFNTFLSRNAGVKSVNSQKQTSEKNALKVSYHDDGLRI